MPQVEHVPPDTSRWTTGCWCVANIDCFVPANQTGWVIDLGAELMIGKGNSEKHLQEKL